MKKQFTLALVALAALCALTGCGNRKETADNNGANSSVTAPNGSTSNPNGSHSVMDDVENGIADTGNAIQDGMNNVGDALTGDNYGNGTTSNGTTQNGSTSNGADTSGVPYDEMLDNGAVHDSDGVLTDGENARSRTR